MTRLSKEQLKWSYANLKKECLSYLIQIAENELKQILTQEDYLREAELFFVNYRQDFVFAHALGRILKTCDDPTYQKALDIIGKVFYGDNSLFIAVIIAVAYPDVVQTRKKPLGYMVSQIDFRESFNADQYIFIYNEMFLANTLSGGEAFSPIILDHPKDKIKELIDHNCFALDAVEEAILFLDKINPSYVKGLGKICQIAGNHYKNIDIKSRHAQILWVLSKRHSSDEEIRESLKKDALEMMTAAADKTAFFNVMNAILYHNTDFEWRTTCFGACTKAIPKETGRNLSTFENHLFYNRDFEMNEVLGYLQKMYAQMLPENEKDVREAIVKNLAVTDFSDKLSSQIKAFVIFAVEKINEWCDNEAKAMLANVLKLYWEDDELSLLEDFIRTNRYAFCVNDLKMYLKYIDIP